MDEETNDISYNVINVDDDAEQEVSPADVIERKLKALEAENQRLGNSLSSSAKKRSTLQRHMLKLKEEDSEIAKIIEDIVSMQTLYDEEKKKLGSERRKQALYLEEKKKLGSEEEASAQPIPVFYPGNRVQWLLDGASCFGTVVSKEIGRAHV